MKSKVLDQLNDLSKGETLFPSEEVRAIAWAGVERLTDAENLIVALLNDQETLAVGIRNDALIEECKKWLQEK